VGASSGAQLDGTLVPAEEPSTASRSVITACRRQPKATYSNGRLNFEIVLNPGEAWHCCLLYTLEDGERTYRAPRECANQGHKGHGETLSDWLRTVLKIRCSNEEFYRLYRQALEDMAALRLPIFGTDHKVFLPAAGLPWFVAPFGRDSLIVSLQNLLIYPDFARGSPACQVESFAPREYASIADVYVAGSPAAISQPRALPLLR
jgi:hypothetical protein